MNEFEAMQSASQQYNIFKRQQSSLQKQQSQLTGSIVFNENLGEKFYKLEKYLTSQNDLIIKLLNQLIEDKNKE